MRLSLALLLCVPAIAAWLAGLWVAWALLQAVWPLWPLGLVLAGYGVRWAQRA